MMLLRQGGRTAGRSSTHTWTLGAFLTPSNTTLFSIETCPLSQVRDEALGEDIRPCARGARWNSNCMFDNAGTRRVRDH
jgi:hypothetical protein